ncbi:hypothetical protein SCP_0212200 [Sparassis crispa]|uniref:Uncharacterized protein n=1 Tax=Sparassis crispa TaxID=139825 RepID=A0A401GCV2_9APHY|nr:hypothetical protein SCP_0212200 [Sparassis crispa]GBE80018.1 hypothetical protein SCP_0212200 [Sparassis crispa]
MANILDEDDVDAETLQAQVDMSMAFTENLVASWMKSSEGKLPSSKWRRQDEEKELEEYMRRPPRLGVGAAIPESTSAFGRDTAKLKNKLTGGAGKKRAREEEREVVVVPSDDEEESRAGAIRKKVKLDPFAKVSKPKEKKNKLKAELSPAKEHLVAVNVEENIKIEDVVPMEGQIEGEQETAAPPSSPKKKKKKKKHKVAGNSVVDLTVSPLSTFSKLAPDSVGSVPSSVKVQEESTVISRFLQGVKHLTRSLDISAFSAISVPSSPEKLASENKARTSVASAANVASSPEKTKPEPIDANSLPPSPAKHASKPTLISGVPLLNLDGPPIEVEEDATTSPKKKRKRKKHKKKKVLADTHVSGDAEEEG